MSAIEKVNSSGLSADEKLALKALMGHKPKIGDQIAEDPTVDDKLLRAYLAGPGGSGADVVSSAQHDTTNSEQLQKRRRIEDGENVMRWLKSAQLDEDILQFDEDCTLPPEFNKTGTGHNILFVREVCWHMLWIFKYVTLDECQDGILVLGPPGCGKTWCSQFFLWYFVVREPHDVVFESVSTKLVWIFRKDGTVGTAMHPATVSTVPELNLRETIYLFDSAAGCTNEMIDCAARKAMWSSANTANYRQSQKLLTALVYITPNKLELQRACEIFGRGRGTPKEVDVEWYFNHSGGALRPPFKSNQKVTQGRLQVSSKQVKLDNILRIVQGSVDSAVASGGDAPSSLFSTFIAAEHLEALPQPEDGKEYSTCEPQDEAAQDALMCAYMTSTVQWHICSEFVFELLSKNGGDQIQDWNKRFLEVARDNPTLGATRGNSFQIYVPRFLAGGAADLRCRALSSDPAAVAETLVHFPPRTLVKIAATLKSEILNVQTVLSKCTDPDTLYNISGNLPAFDHFVPPNYFIQTTSVRKPPHPIQFEAAKLLCAHCAALGLDAVFYFAVPNDTFDLWKRPQPFAIHDAHGKQRKLLLNKLAAQDQAALINLRQLAFSIDLTSFIYRD